MTSGVSVDQRSLQDAFREVMATVCTPVAVVTALSGDRPHGTTVSAFASLSMNPPMVLVALDRTSDLLSVIRESRSFGLNVLGGDQADLATQFATKGFGKFAGVGWQLGGGVPRISGGSGFLACRVVRLVDGGDHVLVLGEVRVADMAEASPLTYHRRAFGTHTPLGGFSE